MIAGLTRGIDRAILDASQTLASGPLDVVGSALSALGGVVVTSVVALALAAWFARRGGVLAATPLLMFAGVALEYVAKRLIDHPAPPVELLRDFHWLAIGSVDSAAGNAYPSGHLVRTTFLALVAAERWPALRALGAVLIALMALSRVYLASHWASDVVGGILLGGLLFSVAAAWERSKAADRRP